MLVRPLLSGLLHRWFERGAGGLMQQQLLVDLGGAVCEGRQDLLLLSCGSVLHRVGGACVGCRSDL